MQSWIISPSKSQNQPNKFWNHIDSAGSILNREWWTVQNSSQTCFSWHGWYMSSKANCHLATWHLQDIFAVRIYFPLEKKDRQQKYRHLKIITLPGHPLKVFIFISSLSTSVVQSRGLYLRFAVGRKTRVKLNEYLSTSAHFFHGSGRTHTLAEC